MARKSAETQKPPHRQCTDYPPPKPMPKSLHQGVVQAFRMACDGESPKACAVVYRSLAREFPERQWLAAYAAFWEKLADSWTGKPQQAAPGNLGNLLDSAVSREQESAR